MNKVFKWYLIGVIVAMLITTTCNRSVLHDVGGNNMTWPPALVLLSWSTGLAVILVTTVVVIGNTGILVIKPLITINDYMSGKDKITSGESSE